MVDRQPAVTAETSNGLGLPVSISIATAVVMAGAVFVVFWILRNFEPPDFLRELPILLSIPLGLPLVLGPLLVAGAIWGAVVAHLIGRPLVPAARTGALAITGMVALLELPVHLSQALPVPEWLPLPFGIHAFFTVIFMSEVALVSGVASARLCKRFDAHIQPRRTGTRVGIAGAVGFAFGSVVAAALGFVVGEPPATNMIWALHVGNVFGGLSAGWQLGRHLDAQRNRWQVGVDVMAASNDGSLCTAESASLPRQR